MIAYLEGQIISVESNLIVLKTSSGVGYSVNVVTQLSSTSLTEELINLHIYTNVREDEISLYGFQELEQKELFMMVIKTSGIGPKMGLAILSSLTPEQLVNAVHHNSTESFSQVPGIGKKTAVKLCLDLKDQLNRYSKTKFGQKHILKNKVEGIGLEIGKDSVFSALKNLGYNEKEIIKVLKDTDNTDIHFEERLKKALSLLTPLR